MYEYRRGDHFHGRWPLSFFCVPRPACRDNKPRGGPGSFRNQQACRALPCRPMTRRTKKKQNILVFGWYLFSSCQKVKRNKSLGHFLKSPALRGIWFYLFLFLFIFFLAFCFYVYEMERQCCEILVQIGLLPFWKNSSNPLDVWKEHYKRYGNVKFKKKKKKKGRNVIHPLNSTVSLSHQSVVQKPLFFLNISSQFFLLKCLLSIIFTHLPYNQDIFRTQKKKRN